MLTPEEQERRRKEANIKQVRRKDETQVGYVDVVSDYVTIVDADFVKYLAPKSKELANIPANELSNITHTSKKHNAITVKIEGYGRKSFPVYVQLDERGQVMSLRVSFVEG